MGAFTGKTVLILGGSRGIGAAIVRRFVTDGANVRFTYAGSKDAAEHLAQETGATAVFTDSADRDAVIDVVCNQVNHLIPTRVLVKGGEITCKILK